MRILLCGGGTAGHINPALAIADIFKANIPNVVISYVVTKNGMENRLVDYPKYVIDIESIRKNISLKNFRRAYKMLKSVSNAKKIINEFKPDLIIGTGGYAMFPVVYAGQKCGVKTILHESNSVPGKAIKMVSKKADLVFLNFRESGKYFSPKCNVVYCGNPLRKDFDNLNKLESRKKLGISEEKVVLCYGGSLGAEKINEMAFNFVKDVIRKEKNIRFIWGTGKREYQKIKDKLILEKLYGMENLDVYEYINEIADKISCSDLVICRAGAMTISELSALGKCSILVPSPNVTDNHQYKNARELEKQDATILICEEDLCKINEAILQILNDDKKRTNIERNIKKFYNKDAKKIIFRKTMELFR
ncbi:MAG: undecaprenyldiphospho-muramoylpentapeptide beta-N-acetylglucosaminyltransferase [Clostridia bacterium]|nr:undecaprenyldiphospho-muramoylpentapeptide beta-N-acetylglucosaminyltransferase [Clostridia bacterium]